MSLTVINGNLTRQLLPMEACIEAMVPAMVAASTGTVDIPPRLISPLIDDTGLLGLMPGSSRDLGFYGSKVFSLHPDNPLKNLPAVQGFVALFDFDSGAPVAIIEAGELTAIRTAAASGLATRLLSREDSHSCGIFGTGAQAVTHIDAMCAVRPLREILVWGRDQLKTRDFAVAQAQRTGMSIRATSDPAEAGACDLICTVTGSPEPVLKGEWVQPGAHVNLVGAHSLSTREADSQLIARAAVYVDLLVSCLNEGGDVMLPITEGVIQESHIIGEIGQLLDSAVAGRTSPEQITLYNSLGITSQDLYAAGLVYNNALALGAGITVEL